MVKMDKVDSTLAAIALKKVLIKDIPLHHNLVKYDVGVLLRAKRYIKLEGIQKNKPVIFVAAMSSIPSRMDETRKLEEMTSPPKWKAETAKYSFQPQRSDRKRRYGPRDEK